jgi:hypothetical protein
VNPAVFSDVLNPIGWNDDAVKSFEICEFFRWDDYQWLECCVEFGLSWCMEYVYWCGSP